MLRVKYRGQQLARPLALVCMDPFSSVDLGLRGEMERLLESLAADGIAVLVFSRLSRIRRMSQYTQDELIGSRQLI